MSTHRINVNTTHAHHWSYNINGSAETHVTPGASYVDVTLEDGNSTIIVKAYGSGNEYLNASDTSVVAYEASTAGSPGSYYKTEYKTVCKSAYANPSNNRWYSIYHPITMVFAIDFLENNYLHIILE